MLLRWRSCFYDYFHAFVTWGFLSAVFLDARQTVRPTEQRRQR